MDDVIVLLKRFPDEYEARLAADILEEAGIPSQLIGETTREAGGIANPYRLYVRTEHAETAAEHLGDYQPPVEGTGRPS